ncbi:MAG: hypothetical protein AAF266_06205 [Planctomycetota bacterium]
MRKPSLLALVLVAIAGASQIGCRACQSCHDYSSPLAGADCGGCNECRSGSCVSTPTQSASMVAEAPTEKPVTR